MLPAAFCTLVRTGLLVSLFADSQLTLLFYSSDLIVPDEDRAIVRPTQRSKVAAVICYHSS